MAEPHSNLYSAPTTTTPTPDPTVLTTEAVTRALIAERDYINAQFDVIRERLRGIDIATEVLNETVNRTPTAIQGEISHLRELSEEKFSSVAIQFKERDTRQEREARDNKVAVDAAFAAQKEAASEQNKSNTLAIAKSEAATAETINKLAELFKTATDALADKIEDRRRESDGITARLTQLESVKQGAREQTATSRASLASVYAAAAFVLTLLVIAATVIALTGQ